MSRASTDNNREIHSTSDLIAWFQSCCTAPEDLLVGVEHEKPPFYLLDNEPVSYAGKSGRPGLRDFFRKMVGRGWKPGYEEERLIEMQKGKLNWTLEPGGQMETGGAPLKNVHETAAETDDVIGEAVEIGQQLGIGLLAAGYHPTHSGKNIPAVPKSRYGTWRDLIEHDKIEHGLDGANCTSALQVNLGYQSEEDMVKMLRVALSLQPIAMSLFANSPFSEGEPTGYQSYRSEITHNFMNGRYGFMLPVAFEEDFGFEKFVDYAINLPLLGIYDKDGLFHDVQGATFKDFMDGNLEAFPGRKPTISDWQNHLNTIWPEVRVRGFLEMRGADNGPAEMIKALPAFWVGLLYDKESLDSAYEMVRDWTDEDREYLRSQTPRTGLQTPFMGTTVQEIAKNTLALSEAGLKRRDIRDDNGNDESVYLAPLHEIAESGKSWATRLLNRFYGRWNGNINKLFEEMNYASQPSVLEREHAPGPQASARQHKFKFSSPR